MNKAQIKKQFDLRGVEDELFGSNYVQSAFEFKPWPVVASEKPETIVQMNWGLIPHWVKDESVAMKLRSNTVNARIETAAEKPSFRKAIKANRCLVLADGFYEFREFNKMKYPYFIQLKDVDAFAMAGLYDDWINPTSGEIVQTFSVLTTEANPLMAKIHNRGKRMPVIIQPGSEKAWLDFTLEPEQLFPSFPEDKMEAWSVSRLLTSRTENKNVPGVQSPFVYPELQMVDGMNL